MTVLTTHAPTSAAQGASTHTLRRASRVAAVLFVTATASTMGGQILVESLPFSTPAAIVDRRDAISLAVVLEILNGLSSAGIALALFPVLRRVSELAATGYLGLRIIEGTLGIVAAAFLLSVFGTQSPAIDRALAYHDAAFLSVLLVFSCGTLLFYPLLYRHCLVPRTLSIWGLIGGLMLLVSCLLILFGRIEIGGQVDLVLSLPIWINEMALAIWLFVWGLELKETGQGADGT